ASFTVDQQGRLTTAANATITSVGTITTGVWNAGTVTTTGGVVVTGGGAVAGSLIKNATYGLTLTAVAGSSTDFSVLDPGTNEILLVPTGTRKVVLPGPVGLALGGTNLTDAVATPTLTGALCGSGPSITGKDYGFIITTGTSANNICVVNFNATYANAPSCTATLGDDGLLTGASGVQFLTVFTSTTQMSVSASGGVSPALPSSKR